MRRTRLAPILAVALFVAALRPAAAFAASTKVSFGFFESGLGPHGDWYESTRYGRVWQPSGIAAGWHPYHRGHWVYTEVGWTWVSDHAWGAIPYHYGTWVVDPALGWAWVPGYVWAPSWVVFRTAPSYVGWAPVPPSFAVGSSQRSSDDVADHFVFVRGSDFLAPEIHTRALPVERARMVFQDTVVASRFSIENDVVVNRGIDVKHIERFAERPVERQPLARVPKVTPLERAMPEALRVDPSHTGRDNVRVVAPTAASEPPRERAPAVERFHPSKSRLSGTR